MRNLFILTLLISSAIQITHAQETPYPTRFGDITKEELSMTTYPLDSQAQAVVLSDIGSSHFSYNDNSGLQLVFERHTRIKILSTEGYQWANVNIPLYHEGGNKEKLVQLKGFTYNLEDGEVVKTKLKKDGQFEEKLDERWDISKFTMPNVRAGSVIEYSYSIVSDYMFNLHEWQFQYEIPVAWSEYKVKIPEYFYYKQLHQGYEPLYMHETSTVRDFFNTTSKQSSQGSGLNTGQVHSSYQRHRVDFSAVVHHMASKNLPALREEKYITTIDDYVSKISFELASVKLPYESPVDYTTSWEKIDLELLEHQQVGKILSKRSAIDDEVKQLIAGKSNPDEKIGAICDFVKNQIKWNENITTFASQTLKQTLEKKTGNAADINLLLIAMLQEAGIETDPVLLSTREHGILRIHFPMLSQYNYVIAMAQVDGKTYLLDATDKNCPHNLLPVRCLNGQGRLVNKKSGEKWVDLSSGVLSGNFTAVNLTLSPDQMLTGRISKSKSHYEALDWRKKTTHYTDKTEAITAAQNKLAGWIVKDYTIEGYDDPQKIIKEEHEVELIDQFVKGNDVIYLNAILEDRLVENPFKQQTRTYPVDIAYPFSDFYMLNLTIPDGYTFDEVPENVVLGLPDKGGSFSYTCNVRGNTLSIMCKTEMKKSLYLPDQYPYLREFMDRIVAKQAEQLIIKKIKGE